MLKKIERVLSSRKNQIWLNNLKCNFSQQQTTKNGQKIINRWQDLFIQSIMVIDFQRSIKNNTIDQLLINHLKTSDQFISLKHLLQLYSRAYIRNSKSIKLFTTELNIRLVQGTPDQHLEAFEVVTKRVFNSFSFLMKINLVSKMIKNFKELSRVQKQRFLNMMLGLDYISKQVLQQYKKQCKKKQQIVFKTNNDVDQQFDYLINKLENISFLKDILRKEQFNQLITSKQYEIILNKYLEKLQDVNSLIVILKSNVPHSIFITKLIFQNQIQIHKYKLRIIALYDTIFNQNVTLFRKNPLQMYIPQILSFFNKNDRYILRHTLMKF